MRQKPLTRVLLNNNIRICARDFKLIGDKGLVGGGRACLYPDNGRGQIHVGIGQITDPYEIFETLLHEIMESIMLQDEVEYDPWRDTTDRRLFCFDHHYFNSLPSKIMDALISCGAIGMPDFIEFSKVQRGRKGRARNVKCNRCQKSD